MKKPSLQRTAPDELRNNKHCNSKKYVVSIRVCFMFLMSVLFIVCGGSMGEGVEICSVKNVGFVVCEFVDTIYCYLVHLMVFFSNSLVSASAPLWRGHIRGSTSFLALYFLTNLVKYFKQYGKKVAYLTSNISAVTVVKVSFIILWIFVTYQGFIYQFGIVRQSDRLPPNMQAENYIVEANSNQPWFTRSNIYLYACSKIHTKRIDQKFFNFAQLLLVLSGDIETNPGPGHWYSLNHPKMCGFFRVAMYFIIEGRKLTPQEGNVPFDCNVDMKEGFDDLQKLFGENYEAHLIDLKTLKTSASRFTASLAKWSKHSSQDKMDYFDYFCPKNWQNLEDAEQKKHTLFCEECLKSCSELQAKFPSTTAKYKQERLENPGYATNALEKTVKNFKKTALTDATNKACDILNKSFEKTFGVTFNQTYEKLNKLEKKKSAAEKRNIKVQYHKEVVNKIKAEDRLSDVDRLYGSRRSLSSWDRDRAKKSFETVPNAKKRTFETNEKISLGLKKRKNHVGNFSSYKIDTVILLEQASTWTDETVVNWKHLGDQCIRDQNNNIPANSGQITKEYLFDKQNNEGFHFTFNGKDQVKKERVRRSLKRVYSRVSVPADVSSKKVKLSLEEKVRSGEIDIGVNIVEKEYKKLIINELSEVVTHTFSVHGRKHPLKKLRVKLFKKYHRYMRLNPDSYFENLGREELFRRLADINEFEPNENIEEMKEKLKKCERSRHFQIWHDGSVIVNHGHILFCVNILYDPAVFYTSAEYLEKMGEDLNIQHIVESPELYIIGRCGSNDEQVGYIETRVDCVKDLKTSLNLHDIDQAYDIALNDTIRLFHGDGPASAFEAGNQKGGYYFCPSCDVHACLTDDIAHCYLKKMSSLSEKQNKVLRGKFGRHNSRIQKTCPFAKLSAKQIHEELKSRNIDVSNLKMTKEDLLPVLTKLLGGIKRVPILLFNHPLIDLKRMGLSKYEIAMVECMHDIGGHIENILMELPHHLKLKDKIKVQEMLTAYSDEKQKKRCCDKRKFLLQLTISLYHKIDGNVHRLLKSLCEIQRILYLGDDFRTANEILRLHNMCFEHFCLLKQVIPIENLSPKMSREKMYGKYQHNLLVHAPLQYRLVSGDSINCEDEERFFHSIRDITKSTTNNWPGHVIGNLIVRQEIESECKDKYEFDNHKNSTFREIHKLGVKLHECQKNSHFTYDYIKENSADWQAHLERISDFLIFGENKWWEKNEFGITFFDVDHIPDKSHHPKVHHFRSSSMTSVSNDLEIHWSSILEQGICIPVHEILFENEDKVVQHKKTEFLNFIRNDFSLSKSSDTLSMSGQKIVVEANEVEANEDITDFELVSTNSVFNSTIGETVIGADNIGLSDCANDIPRSSSVNAIVNSDNIKNEVGCSRDSVKAYSFLSTEAKSIYFVLGDLSPVLKKYDCKKNMFKQGDTSYETRSMLQDMQANLQTQVLKKVSDLNEELHAWELSFFSENNFSAPTESDKSLDVFIADISRRARVGCQLLKSWNIQF